MSITNTVNSLLNTSPAATSTTTDTKKSLQASDFIQMMVTQLQNQDPTEPTKSQDLLAQMSQIGSLQSSTELQSSLKTMTLQNSISNAAAMIGKSVTGKDEDGSDMNGVVTSVKVVDGDLSLSLDSGKSMSLSNVTAIAPTASASAAAA